jgi:ABC-2 type transport system ATP-binding protein
MLTASHLHKQYATVHAVDDVSLEVKKGAIFGLLGPNGAGKTTTIRMLLNIITPDSGTVAYDGAPFSPSLQNKIGYLPEERGLYRKNKLIDTILYFASLKGMEKATAKRTAFEWLRRFELESYGQKKVEELSKGNQQKVQFIISIMHNPEFVVLDEPFSGLDPVNQIVLKDILQELKQQGKAVIFSTHQMDSAEKLCDEICLINHGKIVVKGSIKEVKQQFGKDAVRVEYDGDGSFISSLPFVGGATVYENYAEIVLKNGISSRTVIGEISSRVDLRKFEFVEPSLNSIFLEVVGLPADDKKDEQRSATSEVKPKVSPTDPKVKKAFMSLAYVLLFGLAFGIVEMKHLRQNLDAFSVIGVVVILALIRYIKVRREAKGGRS